MDIKISGVLLTLFSIVALNSVLAQRDGYCLTSDYEPYLQFSTKTAYEFIKGKDDSHNLVSECQPVMFWSLNRHGTRLPGVKTIQELPKLLKTRDTIINNYEIKRTAPDHGRLCDQDLENLKNWIWNQNYTSNFASDLTYQGYDDLRYLAKRWQSKFRDLLPIQFSSRQYLFKYTDTRRTKDSFRAFVDGLFGREAFSSVQSEVSGGNDSILMLHDMCKAWISEVKNNPITVEQINQMKSKEEYKNLIKNVSSHLGFRYPMEENDIKNMYDMCRYDKAWEINKNSPWCAAFTKDQLMLLEYLEDLKYYYQFGYGSQLNKKVGCTPLKDMMNRFTKMIENPNQEQPKAVVYFTHSKTIQSFMTALGVAKDSVPLLADNYHTPNIQQRKWKTSLIDPFASNIAAILHKCPRDNDYKVLFFLNERPIDFSDCQVGLCSWDLLKSKYGKDVSDCNTNFCFKNSAIAYNKFNMNIIIGSLIIISLSKLFSTNA